MIKLESNKKSHLDHKKSRIALFQTTWQKDNMKKEKMTKRQKAEKTKIQNDKVTIMTKRQKKKDKDE